MSPARRSRFAGPTPLLLSLAALLPWPSPAQAQSSPPPPTPRREVADTYYGKVVLDPYRWMEAPVPRNPEFRRWLEAQNDYARAVLDRLPERPALVKQLARVADIVTSVSQVQVSPTRWFYLRLAPGEETPKLYARDLKSTRDRLLLDPDTLTAPAGSHWAIDYVSPSPDGRVVAYGTSLSGSERTTLHLMDAATGRLLPDSISRVQFGVAGWAPDGRSFYYNRLDAAGETDPSQRYRNSAAWRHVLGQPVERDQLLVGPGTTATLPLGPNDFPWVHPVEGSPYLYARVLHGVNKEISLYVAPLKEARGTATAWRKLVDSSDGVVDLDVHGTDVYLLSHKDAPRYRVLRVKADGTGLSQAQVVVPESRAVLTRLVGARDALYVQELDGGLGRLRRLPHGTSEATGVPLPGDGAIAGISTHPRLAGVVYSLESWTRPRVWYRYEPTRVRSEDARLVPPFPIDTAAYETVRVEVTSHDGVAVPLSIITRKGLKRDGARPTLLEGYGAYGITFDPWFRSTVLPWLDRGGVYAVAHVRGGGEHGDEWHRAGKGPTKPNTWKDFIACAEYLIRSRYTSSGRLAGSGTSAGGILIGRAITERPELFRAAVPRVGVMNMVRAEQRPGGPANIPEFGSTATEEGFRALYEMDPLQHLRPGTPYPAVLLTTGVEDSRVEPWEPGKFAAALQEATTSGRPVLLRVDFDAGHGMGLTKRQRVEETADIYSFLLSQFGDRPAS
jgi:prolyl oligopeptidase